MQYEILSEPYYKQPLNVTEVQIFCQSPYTIITRDLAGNLTQEDHDKLIQKVLDQLAFEHDPDTKLLELDSMIDKANAKLEEVDQVISDVKKESEATQGALLELMETVLTTGEGVIE
ncbi:hypothetical protein ACWOBX_08370 [Facklamia languida]